MTHSLRTLFLLPLMFAGLWQTWAEPAPSSSPEKNIVSQPAPQPTAEENASLLRIAADYLAKNDPESARIACEQILRQNDLPPETEQLALLSLARSWVKSGDMVKAAAIYEKLRKTYPDALVLPESCLEHGRVLRMLGAYKLAISQFYNVIHGTLRIPTDQTARYRQLARTAQFEIAETHYIAGNYADAARFFTRLNLPDLAPSDRARAQFKAASSHLRGGNNEAAVAGFREFINQYPGDPFTPEARYQLATLYSQLGRKQDALNTTLELLRSESNRITTTPVSPENTRQWTYWQRRTGVQLAHDFFLQKDYQGALTIYTRLVEISDEPRWRLPALYQAALCHEQLQHTETARDLYRQIVGELTPTPPAMPPPPDLVEIGRQATWRLEHLDWRLRIDTRLTTLAPIPSSLSHTQSTPQ